jgi:hypothetical protein
VVRRNIRFRKMLRFAWDAVTGFSYFPLQIMVYVSLLLGFLAVLAIPVIAMLRLTQGPLSSAVRRPPSCCCCC